MMMMTKIELTDEDKRRIKRSQQYKEYKLVTQTAEENKNFEVGSGVYIKKKTSEYYLSGTRLRKLTESRPTKFLVIENDNGFVFAKRINASGNPGQEILCLTTDFKADTYELIADDEMLDALLLDQEYDPLAEAKKLKKKKNKASRKNNEIRLNFASAKGAYAYIKSLKVGDTLYSAETTFGDNIGEYKVDKIEVCSVSQAKANERFGRNASVHKYHIQAGFKEVISVKLVLQKEHGRWSRQNIDFSFYNICREANFKWLNKLLYVRMPTRPEDI